MNSPIRWGILAPGRIAGKFVSELQSVPNANVVAVGSRNLERAKAFALEFGINRSYGSYEDLVNDPEVDIIYVASPHSFHAEHTLLGLNKGKAVLCEKALAINSTEVEKMIAASKMENTFLMEAFTIPHQPSYKEAKRLLASGILGEIRHIHSWFGFNKSPYDLSQRLFNPALGGGALLDIGLYPIFDVLWFMGIPETTTAHADLASTGTDQSVSATLNYPSGKSASIFASFLAVSGVGTDLYCEKGMLRLRRKDALNQWIELELAGQEKQILTWKESDCGLKLEAIEAMNCLIKGEIESTIMSHERSAQLMKVLDQIRKIAGINYPGID